MLLPKQNNSFKQLLRSFVPSSFTLVGKILIGVTLFFIGAVIGVFVTFESKTYNSSKVEIMTSSPHIEITKPEPYKPKVLGWIPYWDQQKAFESFQENAEVFDFISLFWYQIDKDGNLRAYNETVEDQQIINYAHENNIKVMAVIANLPDYEEGGDWDWKRVNRVISSPQSRQKHIENILKLIDENNLDGVDIDYEALRLEQRDDFAAFIEELSESLHKKDKLLGVAIHPKTSENDPEEANGSQAQDLIRISQAADYLYFMTYEDHNAQSGPGPIGSLEWVERVLSYAINDLKIDKEKVFDGIPLYGYDWNISRPAEEARELEYNEVIELLEETGSKSEWNSRMGETQITYLDRRGKHEVWFNDAKSVSVKLELARIMQVGGIGIWRLGGEDPDIWEAVKTFRSGYRNSN